MCRDITHFTKTKRGRDREEVTSETLPDDRKAKVHILQKQKIGIAKK